MYDKDIIEAAKKDKTLPKPVGHMILIVPPTVSETTEGGVHLTDEHQDREALAAIVGYVLELGTDCYVSTPEKTFPSGPYCKVGDWVLFRSYSGIRFSLEGTKFLVINDDTVNCVVKDPRRIIRS